MWQSECDKNCNDSVKNHWVVCPSGLCVQRVPIVFRFYFVLYAYDDIILYYRLSVFLQLLVVFLKHLRVLKTFDSCFR